jgi:hypothetical protein
MLNMILDQLGAAYFTKGEAVSHKYYTALLLSGNPGSVVRA